MIFYAPIYFGLPEKYHIPPKFQIRFSQSYLKVNILQSIIKILDRFQVGNNKIQLTAWRILQHTRWSDIGRRKSASRRARPFNEPLPVYAHKRKTTVVLIKIRWWLKGLEQIEFRKSREIRFQNEINTLEARFVCIKIYITFWKKVIYWAFKIYFYTWTHI